MRTSSKTVDCPACGLPATMTLAEQPDARGAEGHVIQLRCSNPKQHPPATEVELLRLWAADHLTPKSTALPVVAPSRRRAGNEPGHDQHPILLAPGLRGTTPRGPARSASTCRA